MAASNSKKQPSSPPSEVEAKTLKSSKMSPQQLWIVETFLNEFNLNPQQYAEYGSEDWVQALIKFMKTKYLYGITPPKVRQWMETEDAFLETNQTYEYCPITKTAGTAGFVEDIEFLSAKFMANMQLEPTEVLLDEPTEETRPTESESE